jgi:transcriptional regulator with XRE-family HTH domain
MRYLPRRSTRGGPGKPPNLRLRRRVLQLRARGLPVGEIGRRLGVSTQTVCNHLKAAGQGPLSARCADCGRELAPGVRPPAGTAYCLDCLEKYPDCPFGTRLRSLRLAAGLSVKDLGERVGGFGTAVSAQERGRDEPSWSSLVRLARVLGPGVFPPGPAGPGRKGLTPARRRRLTSTDLRCRACGEVIAARPAQVNNNAPALCLACLGRHPDAPFADRLKAHRLAAGLTLKELAERVGAHLQSISDYECGRAEPKWRRLARLVAVLGPGLVASGGEAGERERGRAVP